MIQHSNRYGRDKEQGLKVRKNVLVCFINKKILLTDGSFLSTCSDLNQ